MHAAWRRYGYRQVNATKSTDDQEILDLVRALKAFPATLLPETSITVGRD
jgi:hypothetical protein